MVNRVTKIKNLVYRFKDLSAMGISNIIGSGISALFWFYLATIISTEEYGQVSFLIAIAGISSVVALAGSGGTITVYRAKNIPIEPPVFTIALITAIITSLTLFFIFSNVSISLYVMGYVIFGISGGHLLGQKFYVSYAKYQIIQRIIFAVLSIPLYYIIGIDGIVLGVALSFLPPIHIIIRVFRTVDFNFTILKERSGFMIYNYLKDLSRVLSGQLDRIIIAPMFGFAILGNYHLGIQFLSLLTIIPSIVFQYTLAQDASGVSRNRLKKWTIIFSTIMSILGITIGPMILPLIFPKFENIGEIIRIFSIAIIPRTISMMMMSKYLGDEKSKIVLIGSAIFILIQIVSIIILGETYGVVGIAISLVFAELSMMTFFLLIRKNKKTMNNPL